MEDGLPVPEMVSVYNIVTFIHPRIHDELELDRHVILWDFHQDDIKKPSWQFSGPQVYLTSSCFSFQRQSLRYFQANVFTLAFSATNQYLYS